jgi:hypothetical protein
MLINISYSNKLKNSKIGILSFTSLSIALIPTFINIAAVGILNKIHNSLLNIIMSLWIIIFLLFLLKPGTPHSLRPQP